MGANASSAKGPPPPPVDILKGCKVTYFPLFLGRGGQVKLALVVGGVDFESDNVDWKEWPNIKKGTPFGHLPILELKDGTKIAEARCILRFVGTITGTYPAKDIQKAAQVDQLMDAIEDLMVALGRTGAGMDQAAKEAARKEAVVSGPSRKSLEMVDLFIGGSSGDGKHAVGTSFTIADIVVGAAATNIVDGLYDGVPPNALDDFKNIQAVRKTLATHPAVVKWIDASDDPKAQMWKDMRNL